MDFHLSHFLKRYDKLSPPEREIKQAVCNAIHSLHHIAIAEDAVKISRDTIFLEVHPLIKQRVMEREEPLLQEIENILHKKTVRAIR